VFAYPGLVAGSWHLPILALHLSATSIMVGVICFVQHVHYPLKSFVGKEQFAEYQTQHVNRTGHVVGLPMVVEAALALLLVVDTGIHGQPLLALAGLFLLVGVWLCTAVFQVPEHQRLLSGYDPKRHHRLVATNWIRTVLWMARAGVAVALLVGRS